MRNVPRPSVDLDRAITQVSKLCSTLLPREFAFKLFLVSRLLHPQSWIDTQTTVHCQRPKQPSSVLVKRPRIHRIIISRLTSSADPAGISTALKDASLHTHVIEVLRRAKGFIFHLDMEDLLHLSSYRRPKETPQCHITSSLPSLVRTVSREKFRPLRAAQSRNTRNSR